jgi:site-specific recombinase XerD
MPTDQDTELKRAAEAWLLDGTARRLTVKTLRYYRQRLTAFIAHMEGQHVTDLAHVTATHLRTYFAGMQARGLAEDTQATAARVLRAFFNFCVSEELLTVSPMRKVRLPRPSKRILPAFTASEVAALLAACADSQDPDRDKALLLCLLDTGCRAAEFVALNTGDVDLTSGAVHVWQGKGGKDRTVYLGAKARKALRHYLTGRSTNDAKAALWVNLFTGERLTYWGLAILLRRIGQRAGVAHCAPHTFRRTFALWSLRAGMNIYALQELMGHANLSMLRRYLALTENDVQAAHRAHGPIDSML